MTRSNYSSHDLAGPIKSLRFTFANEKKKKPHVLVLFKCIIFSSKYSSFRVVGFWVVQAFRENFLKSIC